MTGIAPIPPFLPLFAILAAGILTMRAESRWALTSFQLAVLVLAASRIVMRWRNRRIMHWDTGAVVLGAIPLWGGLQLILGWSVVPDRTAEEMVHFVVAAAAFALALELDARSRDHFLTCAAIFGAGIGLAGMITAFSGPPDELPNFGPFVYRNQLAAFMEVLVPVALLRAFEQRDRAYLYIGSAAMMVASVVAAGSRTGTVLLVTELIVVPLAAARRGLVSLRTLTRLSAGILGAVVLLTLAAGWQPLWERFQEANPLQLRWNLDRSSWAMFWDRPWTGFGLGAWPEVYPGFALYDDGTYVNQAHNDWAQWAVEGGLPLLAGFLILAARATCSAWRTVSGLGVVVVLLHAVVDYPFQQRPALAVFLFVMLALASPTSSAQVPLKIRSSQP